MRSFCVCSFCVVVEKVVGLVWWGGFLYLWAGGSVGRLGGGVVLGWLSYCVTV